MHLHLRDHRNGMLGPYDTVLGNEVFLDCCVGADLRYALVEGNTLGDNPLFHHRGLNPISVSFMGRIGEVASKTFMLDNCRVL